MSFISDMFQSKQAVPHLHSDLQVTWIEPSLTKIIASSSLLDVAFSKVLRFCLIVVIITQFLLQ